MNTKKCNVCGEIKELVEFFYKRNSNTYSRGYCRLCYNNKVKEYKAKNKAIISAKNKEYGLKHKKERKLYRKKFYLEHKEYELARNKKYVEHNKDKMVEYYKQYTLNHKHKRSEYYKQYVKNNVEKIRIKNKVYSKKRKLIDPVFKLRSRLSTSIWISLMTSNGSKYGKSMTQYLPYKIIELKEHLEKQFESWMNWTNYGKYILKTWDDNDSLTWTWNIDHIIPQSKLPYASMEEENFKKCWALTNLRPYSSKQNIIDGASKSRHGNI